MSDNSKDKKYLIVIGREYGSGGRRIGRMLADALGFSYYDKGLLSEAANRLGFSREIFAGNDERRPSLLRSLLSLTYGVQSGEIGNATMSDENLYELQSQVIKEICMHESCVIVGRTADYIMREHPHILSIFVHAPIEKRAESLVNRGEASNIEAAEEIAQKNDRNRASFYNYYTNRDGWGKASNYHLSFDSSRMADEVIISTVKAMLKSH